MAMTYEKQIMASFSEPDFPVNLALYWIAAEIDSHAPIMPGAIIKMTITVNQWIHTKKTVEFQFL